MKKEYIKPTSKVVITNNAILAGSLAGSTFSVNKEKNGYTTNDFSAKGGKVNFLDDEEDYEF